MDAVLRLQPLDYVLALLWAGTVGIGVRTGVVRQVIFVVALYLAAIAASQLYKPAGIGLSNFGFGRGAIPMAQWFSYVFVFLAIFGAVTILSKRMYPHTALAGRRRTDALLGGIAGALAGLLLVIQIVTVIRFYGATPNVDNEGGRLSAAQQVQRSQLVPVLQFGSAPLWGLLAPWFPDPLRGVG
ncbi:MAG: CvpA family protein [Chloroflexi bacterium]|nr:CvpA family protein [Chloroflexota bacterium]